MYSGIPEEGAVPEEGDFDVDDSISSRGERDGENEDSNGPKRVPNADSPTAPRKSNKQLEAARRVQRLENKKLKNRAQNQRKRPFRKAKLMDKRRKLPDIIEPAFADEAGLHQHLSVDGWQGTPFGGTLVHKADALRRIPFANTLFFMRTWFPNVCERLVESNKKAEPQLQNGFGLFPLLTVDLPDEQQSAFTEPRRDWKSPASSICVMIAGGSFDTTTQHNLVLDELVLTLEVPKGVAVAFPAALLTHYEHSFAAPCSDDTHTSMIWSAQADVLAHRELGGSKEAAKARGVDTEDRLVHTIFRLAI